jgi:hypothetical protein
MSKLGAARFALLAVLGIARAASAGPPYVTDDPDPVPYRHWELYLASQGARAADETTATAPHLEVNYGVVPGVQLHVLAPLAVDRAGGGPTAYGLGDTELGVKVRFIEQGAHHPMIGTFPQFELPTGSEARGLGTGHLHVFVPLWFQVTAGKWLTYGGPGYWINPGQGNRDYLFLGWLVQRQVMSNVSVGAEVYYTGADTVGGSGSLQFDLGSVIDVTDHHHILVSIGRSIVGATAVQWYAAYQLTI